MSEIKLIRLIPELMELGHFQAIDFKRELTLRNLRLHREDVIVKGERTESKWWGDVTINQTTGALEFSDLFVREDYVFTRDANNLALYRTHDVIWICDDDTEHPDKKVMPTKFYSVLDRMAEGKRRRRNIVDRLEYDMIGWIAVTESVDPLTAADMGRALFQILSADATRYLDVQDMAITTTIQDDTTTTWLDNVIAAGPPAVTIRAALIDSLTI